MAQATPAACARVQPMRGAGLSLRTTVLCLRTTKPPTSRTDIGGFRFQAGRDLTVRKALLLALRLKRNLPDERQRDQGADGSGQQIETGREQPEPG